MTFKEEPDIDRQLRLHGGPRKADLPLNFAVGNAQTCTLKAYLEGMLHITSLAADKILRASPYNRRFHNGLAPLVSPYMWENSLLENPLKRYVILGYCLFESFFT